MNEHLWPLLRLQADSQDELKQRYRDLYIETYVKTRAGEEVIINDWCGNRVIFGETAFDHAFSESSNYRFSYGIHEIPFSHNRARRILWIREALLAAGCTVERLHQTLKDSRGRMTKKRRVLVVAEENYVVVLEETKTEKVLNFITAFPADESYLDKIRGVSLLVETKKPQSYGD